MSKNPCVHNCKWTHHIELDMTSWTCGNKTILRAGGGGKVGNQIKIILDKDNVYSVLHGIYISW